MPHGFLSLFNLAPSVSTLCPLASLPHCLLLTLTRSPTEPLPVKLLVNQLFIQPIRRCLGKGIFLQCTKLLFHNNQESEIMPGRLFGFWRVVAFSSIPTTNDLSCWLWVRPRTKDSKIGSCGCADCCATWEILSSRFYGFWKHLGRYKCYLKALSGIQHRYWDFRSPAAIIHW